MEATKYDPPGNLTFESWVNIQGSGSNSPRIITNGAINNSWEMYQSGASVLTWWVKTTNGTTSLATASLGTGSWHHLAGVYNGSNITLYVDGSQYTQTPLTGTILGAQSIATISMGGETGAHDGGTASWMSGYLDEIRISGTNRSADWISTEYCNQSTSCVFYSTGPVNVISNPVITVVSTFTVTATWVDIPGATGYEVDASTASNFSGTLFSSATTNASATGLAAGYASPLTPNTTYYVRAGNISSGTTNYVNTVPASTSTLANPVTGAQISAIANSSITVNWVALAASPSSATAEGYELDVSTDPAFGIITASSVTTNVNLSTLTVSGLPRSATYFFRVGSLNWNGIANDVSVPGSVPLIGWSNGCNYRQAITIDHTKVGTINNTDQTNFPFLFRGTYTYLATQTNGGVVTSTSGYDIIFSTDPNGGSRLPHEIETYSSTTGNVNMWTQIPTVSHSTNTVIYLFYDNPSITTSQQNTSGVWDGNYDAVFHLPNGTTLTANDSTVNGNNGTITNATATPGQIDGAASFNGGSSRITHSSFNLGSTNLTTSAWVYSTNFNQNAMVVEKDPVNSDWELFFEGGSLKLRGASLTAVTTSDPSNSAWHYIVGTITGTTGTLFVDGVQASQGSLTAVANTSNVLNIGDYGSGGGYFYGGSIDEVRVSSAVRSADWIITEYNNQCPGCVFYSTGPINTINNPVITAVSTFSLTVGWTDAFLATGYEVDASTASDFSGTLFSSVTTNTAAVSLVDGYATPLSPNTTYYVRLGDLAGATTYYPNTVPVSTSTLANPVTGAQIYATASPGVTVNWVALPASPSTGTSEGYELDASTDPAFGVVTASSITANVSLSTLTVSGLTSLSGLTTYYFRVGSLNWDGGANDISVPGSALLGPATYYWTGMTSTVWTVNTNWNPNGVPGPLDTVVIDTNSANQPVLNTTATVYAVYIATSGVYRSTFTISEPLTVSSGVIVGTKGVMVSSITQQIQITGNLTVQSGGLLTHTQNLSSTRTSEINLNVGGTFNLQAGATIYADGVGYLGGPAGNVADNGPGAGGYSSNAGIGGGGGGHGGAGGAGNNSANGGVANDSAEDPVDLGSGGGAGANAGVGIGGNGGGAVLITANTLDLNGLITANGLSGGAENPSGGSGAGGSVNLNVVNLSGTGTVRANGGAGALLNYNPGGGGGGGRVAIYVSGSESACGLTVTASGGASSSPAGSGNNSLPGQTGTIVYSPPTPSGSYTKVWVGSDSDDWNVSTNWSPPGFPERPTP